MGKLPRFVLIAVGAVVALILLVVVCLPLFLNADSFRARIESTLTKSLGRKVSIGKLNLSVWSGGLVATNATVEGEAWTKKINPATKEAEPNTLEDSFSFPTFNRCEALPFSPTVEVEPDQHTAATPSGVTVTVKVYWPGAEYVCPTVGVAAGAVPEPSPNAKL